VPRLRRIDRSEPGITRRRPGSGFSYEDQRGRLIRDRATRGRIEQFAIPPAWSEVWISPDPAGHLQATGIDDAGRRQYLYHPLWRARRDVQKFKRVEAFAHRLPTVREAVEHDLGLEGLPRPRLLACAIRLLDQGYFRIGSEIYHHRNGSFGLATMLRRHVSFRDGKAVFDFTAKSGKRRVQIVDDPALLRVIRALLQRHGGGAQLLAYRTDDHWRPLRAAEINDHLKALAGEGFSAKDFRTWHATVLAAVTIAREAPAGDKGGRRRQVWAVVNEVALALGNTPAVCRASYIDPRIFDRFHEGITIADKLPHIPPDQRLDPGAQKRLEETVLDLLREGSGVARVAA
jgi:DNA topoisomerase IB